MNNKTLHTWLTAWLITAVVLCTGIIDIAAAFIRTNLVGTPTGECGYWYGYEAWYGYSNGYGTTCTSWGWSSSSIGGGWRYTPTPIPWTTNNTPTISKPVKTSTGSTTNPYGEHYGARDEDTVTTWSTDSYWDDNISQQHANIDTNTMTNTTTSSPYTVTQQTTTRRLPATGI